MRTLEQVRVDSEKEMKRYLSKPISDELKEKHIERIKKTMLFIETGMKMFEEEKKKGNYFIDLILKNEKNPVDIFEMHPVTNSFSGGYVFLVKDLNSGYYKFMSSRVSSRQIEIKGVEKLISGNLPFEFEVIYVAKVLNLKLVDRFFYYAFYDKSINNPYRVGNKENKKSRTTFFNLEKSDLSAIEEELFPSFLKSFLLKGKKDELCSAGLM